MKQMPFVKLATGSVIPIALVLQAASQNPASADAARNMQMGIATHLAQYGVKCLPLLASTGVGWVRDGVDWSSIEKQKGVYVVPPKTREWIKAVHAHGLKLIFTIDGGNSLYQDPYDPEAYAAFAAAMTKQLKGDVDAFEILNEPANFGYTKQDNGSWNGINKEGRVEPWVGRYVTLINKAAVAIKAADPNVKVIGLGSVAPVNFHQLAMGISPSVDGVVDHPYSMRAAPELVPYPSNGGIVARDGIATADAQGTFASQIRMYREQSEKYHGPKEMWLTEWGFPTYQPTAPNAYAGYTQTAQAKYIQRRFVESLGLGVTVSVVYDFEDDHGVNPHDPEWNFGLVTHDLKPKPSYYAVKRLVRVMEGWKVQTWGDVRVSPYDDRPDTWPIVWDSGKLASSGAIRAYQFVKPSGARAVALWSTERASSDLSPRAGEITITDNKKVAKIEIIDMMTDVRIHPAFHQVGANIVLKEITLPDSPVLMVLTE
ncbi:MAG: hypothetical protein ABIY70_03615 [Capsulimonas sp.]|uniref:hypothetical protein n=1 Tax=Capsulimonas sp. TaxID=2494211 RepID=UPI0032650469